MGINAVGVHGYSSATFFEYQDKPGIIPTYMKVLE